MLKQALLMSFILVTAPANAELWKGTLYKSSNSHDNQGGDFVSLAEPQLKVTIKQTWKRGKPVVKGFRCAVKRFDAGSAVKCSRTDRYGSCKDKRSLYIPLESPGVGMIASELTCSDPFVSRTVFWSGWLRNRKG